MDRGWGRLPQKWHLAEAGFTSAVVLTTVPVAARGCSQSSSAVKSAGVIEYASHWLQRWWKTSCTHPPPCSSAAVT
jgi:hypothetical protein